MVTEEVGNYGPLCPSRLPLCDCMIETMSNERPRLIEQVEAAQGRDLFRSPGQDRLAGKTVGEAEASDWIEDESIRWPSEETVEGVTARRHELYETMRRLEAAVARPSGLTDWRLEIETAITDLDRSLDDHIRRTESDEGLFADILDGSPHLARRIADLEKEHEELRTTCRRALLMAADWSPESLRRRANVLLARLALHRQTGAELLYDAYNVDIATGD